MRVLHFSDIHVHEPLRAVAWREWRGRRLWGGLPVALQRGARFRRAAEKMDRLAEFASREAVDFGICSGDLTELASAAELSRAAIALQPLAGLTHGLLCVPGNHDIYYHGNAEPFWDAFGTTLASDLPETRADGRWPVVRLLGEQAAVIAVNSVLDEPPPVGAFGAVPDTQLNALESLLADPRIRRRFVFVVLHHVPLLAGGIPDRPSHCLRNTGALLESCRNARRGAILAGHVHDLYHFESPETPLRVFCAGSATEEGNESAWLFDLSKDRAAASKVRWNGDEYAVAEPPSVNW